MIEGDLIQAADLIKNSRHTTAFTGAGISVESGIPPFRGPEGLWSKYDPIVLDLEYFHTKPKESWKVIREIFYDFFGKAKPNKAHEVLALMEKKNLLKAVITQNIDNLHQQAGSKNVYEFHGTAQFLECTVCKTKYHSSTVNLTKLPPHCKKDDGLLKPDFIFFGEGIPTHAYSKSVEEAEKAEVFIIVGTTGEIVPASYIPQIAKQKGAKIIEINKEKSNFTNSVTDIFLQGNATEVFEKLQKLLKI